MARRGVFRDHDLRDSIRSSRGSNRQQFIQSIESELRRATNWPSHLCREFLGDFFDLADGIGLLNFGDNRISESEIERALRSPRAAIMAKKYDRRVNGGAPVVLQVMGELAFLAVLSPFLAAGWAGRKASEVGARVLFGADPH